MPKKTEQYKPSPWLKEELDPQSVKIPPAMIGALYRLQQDENETEYGGAVDFELLLGTPTVEKVLAYTGAFRIVTGEVWEKVFQNPDIELTFHTHPSQDIAIPSEGDIMFILETKPSAMMIVAGKESLIIVKGEGTPPPEFVWQHKDTTYSKVSKVSVKGYDARTAKKEQRKMVEDLKRELDIRSYIIPQEESIEITLRVVQDYAREGRKLKLFKP